LLTTLYPAFFRLPRFSALSFAYRSLPRFLPLITLYPLSPLYRALHCFLPLTTLSVALPHLPQC
jgi:hypothetical protein